MWNLIPKFFPNFLVLSNLNFRINLLKYSFGI